MDPVRVCIVGLGWTGSNHYAGYAAIPDKAQVVAVVARSAEKGAKARDLGIPKVYASFDEALRDDEIDALSICTPHFHHAEMLLAAMEAGKHAIGETPACMTLEECRQLRIGLYEHPGLTMATGHVVRAWRTYSQAKRLVDQGALGEVFYLHSNYIHKPTADEFPSQSSWGRSPRARMHLGIAYHSVDLLRWLAGPVAEVSGDYTEYARIAVLRFANGALGHVFQSTSVVMPYSLPLYVYGTEASLHCYWEEQTLKGYLHRSAEWAPERLEAMPLHGRGSPEWRYELEAFVDAIREGGEPLCPLREGIATVEACLAVDEAMAHQTRVRVRVA